MISFSTYVLVALFAYGGTLAGVGTSILASEELKSGRTWFAHSRKIVYVLLIAATLFFLAVSPWSIPVIFLGFLCAYVNKIFVGPMVHVYVGFLFFLAGRDIAFLLTSAVAVFLFYFTSGAAGMAHGKGDVRKRMKAVLLRHLPFFVCLPLYALYVFFVVD